MKKKVTIYDVAEKLNISTATVNRAINGKPKVSEETRRLVIETANEMGYRASKAASSLSRNPIKVGVLINASINDFLDKFEAGCKKALNELVDFNVIGEIFKTKRQNDVDSLKEKVFEFIEKGFDALIIVPPDHENEFDEFIQKTVPKDIIVTTAVSDINMEHRLFSVRNNGRIAGKMAAELLYWLVGNKPVAIVTGTRDSTVHSETIIGFKEFMDDHPMNLVGIYEHRDDPEVAYHLAGSFLNANPNIAGIYFGSANSATFCRRIEELGYKGRVKIVASDIFPDLIKGLKDGLINATIFQNPYLQGRQSVRYVYESIAEGRTFEKDTIYLNPQIVLPSNIELFL